MTSSLDNLTQINLDDLINALGIQNQSNADTHHAISFFTAQRAGLHKQMIDFDSMAGTRGLAEAARMTERLYVHDVCVFGSGPFAGFRVPCFIQSSRHDRYAGPLRRLETRRS